jgi:hypothetical protein
MQIWQLLTLELWSQAFLDGGAKEFENNLIQQPQAASA